MALPAKALVDLRIYTIRPRAMAEFTRVWDQLAMPVQLRTLGSPLGFYKSSIGPLNQFVHLWGYDSLADYETRIRERDQDPQWPAYLAASAQLITAQENRLLNRIGFESLQTIQVVPRANAHSD
jgi:hypothetical protein